MTEKIAEKRSNRVSQKLSFILVIALLLEGCATMMRMGARKVILSTPESNNHTQVNAKIEQSFNSKEKMELTASYLQYTPSWSPISKKSDTGKHLSAVFPKTKWKLDFERAVSFIEFSGENITNIDYELRDYLPENDYIPVLVNSTIGEKGVEDGGLGAVWRLEKLRIEYYYERLERGFINRTEIKSVEVILRRDTKKPIKQTQGHRRGEDEQTEIITLHLEEFYEIDSIVTVYILLVAVIGLQLTIFWTGKEFSMALESPLPVFRARIEKKVSKMTTNAFILLSMATFYRYGAQHMFLFFIAEMFTFQGLPYVIYLQKALSNRERDLKVWVHYNPIITIIGVFWVAGCFIKPELVFYSPAFFAFSAIFEEFYNERTERTLVTLFSVLIRFVLLLFLPGVINQSYRLQEFGELYPGLRIDIAVNLGFLVAFCLVYWRLGWRYQLGELRAKLAAEKAKHKQKIKNSQKIKSVEKGGTQGPKGQPAGTRKESKDAGTEETQNLKNRRNK